MVGVRFRSISDGESSERFGLRSGRQAMKRYVAGVRLLLGNSKSSHCLLILSSIPVGEAVVKVLDRLKPEVCFEIVQLNELLFVNCPVWLFRSRISGVFSFGFSGISGL